ncbi:pentapeptide repeat-containing protein [Vibrio furnissii]|nr:pentapeptide repeat-containing protein [Vibrio furnissii]
MRNLNFQRTDLQGIDFQTIDFQRTDLQGIDF